MLKKHMAEDLRRIAMNMGTAPLDTGRLLPGERRAVAVLFLDISGFSAMAEKMDFELVHILMNGVMQTLSGIVSNMGGYVDKFEGDRIMALFGARTAGENDSVRAVDCAVRMLDAIEQVNGMLAAEDIRLSARVGVAFGQVIVAPDASGHLTATGDVVNIASRLESLAQIGWVTVSKEARKECGETFLWKDLGEMSIRGRVAPVHAYSPLGPGKLRSERWERAARISSTPLMGRGREMSALRTAWYQLKPGVPGVAEILGEAGIGKSRLIREFTREAAETEHGTIVISGRCLAIVQPPLGIWSTLLEEALSRYAPGTGTPALLIEHLTGISGEEFEQGLMRALPFLTELLSSRTSVEGISEESRLKETTVALGKLLEAFSHAGDLIVVLEDLHWMDRASRDVLEFVLAWLTPGRKTLFLLSRRPDSRDDNDSGAVAGLEIRLAPLTGEDGGLLIRHMLGSGVPRGVAASILSRAGGNPFFIEELVLNLIESGGIIETSEGWRFAGECGLPNLPPSVRAILTARIDRLSNELKGILQMAAVLGDRFREHVLDRLSRISGEASGSALSLKELSRRGFLRATDSKDEQIWVFHHALVREAAYEMLLLQNRAVLHRNAAEVLSEELGDRGDMAVVIADHWNRAGNLGKAIEWGEKALAHCRLHYLTKEGIEVADQLLDWISGQPGSSFRENSLFEVQMQKESFLDLEGSRDQQKTLLDTLQRIAETSGRQDFQVMASQRLGRMLTFTGKLEEAESVLVPALKAARGMKDRSLLGRLLSDAAALSIKRGRPDEGISHSREAVDIFRGSGDRNSECTALNSLGAACWNTGNMPGALECFSEAHDLSREIGNRWFEGNTLLNMGVINRCMGRHQEALKLYLEALKLTRETGNMQSEANAQANLGILSLLEGNPDEARGRYLAALSIYRRTGDRLLQLQTLAKLGRLAMKTRRYDEAEEHLREAIALQKETGHTRDEGETLNSLAELLHATGRTDEARQHLGAALASSMKSGCTPDRFNSLCLMAEIAFNLGEKDEASRLCSEARSLCGELDGDEDGFQRLSELENRLTP